MHTELDLIGIFAFAISGALLAIHRDFDVVGIAILAVITALGGGLLRDLVLGDTPPPAFTQWEYLAVPLAAATLGVTTAVGGGVGLELGGSERGRARVRPSMCNSSASSETKRLVMPVTNGYWRYRCTPSAVLGVREVEAAAGVPLRALVAVRGDAAGVLEHPREVQQVPRHERGVAVGEVVVGAA